MIDVSVAASAPSQLPPAAQLLGKAKRENFPVALRVVPRPERTWLQAIYGYARLVDDIGDLAEGDRFALLDWVEHDLDRAYDGRAEHELLRALTLFLRARDVPRDPFLRLLEANRQDQRVARYATFDELVRYCTLSANPVGELVLRVFGVATPERVAQSDSVCTALQLAEHWQDVGEDYARGRLYLPREDLDRFGVTEGDLAAGPPSSAFAQLMEFEIGRARSLLDPGIPLVRSLSRTAKLAVAAYVAGGHSALDAVERSGYDVLARIPRAGTVQRLGAIFSVLREAR